MLEIIASAALYHTDKTLECTECKSLYMKASDTRIHVRMCYRSHIHSCLSLSMLSFNRTCTPVYKKLQQNPGWRCFPRDLSRALSGDIRAVSWSQKECAPHGRSSVKHYTLIKDFSESVPYGQSAFQVNFNIINSSSLRFFLFLSQVI